MKSEMSWNANTLDLLLLCQMMIRIASTTTGQLLHQYLFRGQSEHNARRILKF